MTSRPARSLLNVVLHDAVEGVNRRPERPRGPLILTPTAAARLALVAGVMALGVAIFISIAFLFDGGSRRVEWLATWLLAPTAAGFGITAAIAAGQRVAATTGLRTPALTLAIIGAGSAALWGFMFLVGEHFDWRFLAFIASVAGTGTLLCVAGTVTCVQLGAPTISVGLRRYRRVAVGVLDLSAGCFVASIWIAFAMSMVDASGPGLALVTLVSLGYIAFPIGLVMCVSASGVAQRMERKRAKSSETLEVGASVRFACPGCGSSQERGRGLHRCSACGTRVRIRMEEPRCRCGYALFRLPADQCPECGEPIPDADRYRVERFESGETPSTVAADQPVASPAEIESDTSAPSADD